AVLVRRGTVGSRDRGTRHVGRAPADAGGEQRIEAGRRNAQLGEEAGHLVQVVQLAPAGADEDGAERESRQGGADPRQAPGGGRECGFCSRKKVHGLLRFEGEETSSSQGARYSRVTAGQVERT